LSTLYYINYRSCHILRMSKHVQFFLLLHISLTLLLYLMWQGQPVIVIGKTKHLHQLPHHLYILISIQKSSTFFELLDMRLLATYAMFPMPIMLIVSIYLLPN